MLSCFSRIQLFLTTKLLCPWNSPGKNTGVGWNALLKGIFLTQRLSLHLLCLWHWQLCSLSLILPGKPLINDRDKIQKHLWKITEPMFFSVYVIDIFLSDKLPWAYYYSFRIVLVSSRLPVYNGRNSDSVLWLFSCSVVSDSLQPHGLQHARLPCFSPSSGACSNWCPLSWWCYLIISSSVIAFSSFLQSFLASGCFLMS